MEFNELLEKFLNDPSFEEEVASISDRSSYNELAKKYNIPYSLEELRDLANNKAETTNCGTHSKNI